MARRSEHTREELTQMAVDSGVALIKGRGFQNFSARAVAADMGYTVGTLYHLFNNLDTFILHINAQTLDKWLARFKKLKPGRPEMRARAFAQSYYGFARDNYNLWTALFEHKMKPEEIPDWYKPKMIQMFAAFEETILPHAENDSKKASKLAKTLWASVHGICVLSLAGKLAQVDADPAEKMIDDLFRLILKKG